MPINSPDYSYLGSGELHLRKRGAAKPFRGVGNCSAFSFSPQTNRINLLDSTQPGGGNRNSVDRITEVQVSFTMHDFSAENFADVLRGTATTIVAGNAADEAVVAYKDGVTPLANLAADITAVKPVTGDAVYEKGKDWDIKNGALYVPADSKITVPADGAANIKVTYSFGAAERLQALVNPNEEYELLFLGFNEARSGKKVRAQAYRVSGGVIGELALIGEQYGAGTVTGTLSKDTSKPAGVSQYFTWDAEK
ncbi:hypothetical protein KWH04_16535 [Xanthomonas campestris pv. trichodesmae]|uniref:Phage tail protein n=2 Tax=Xanthomonas citri TaxID=346 RepID=A0AB33CBH5_XANCI|nr:hypothetical protein [Xanthomonas citri]ASK90533.1 hypothetical protein XcvCFBP7111P_02555 [Xanthomonas citri pv. vignicola]MBV6782218.1 hypothetical protein [Xanthomonas campestris pv. trichodesmae]MBZ3923885.1 hypothetical protein [Xanthomonas citri pv. sesbaniae]OOW88539.1 hypothetical protein Xvtf_12540 [Xanthomonas campestris pv. vitistrifoliae]